MEKLLLLHGAIGSKTMLDPLAKILAKDFEVHQMNFEGHGDAEKPSRPFSMKGFAENILSYLDQNKIAQAKVFGYSMGGYAALTLAKDHPNRISALVTLATKFDWSPESAAKEVKMLNPEVLAAKVPAFAKVLAERHGENRWAIVLNKTAKMLLELGANPDLTEVVLKAIQMPVTIGIGDADRMVSIEESRMAAKALDSGQLEIIARLEHPMEKASPEALAAYIRNALNH